MIHKNLPMDACMCALKKSAVKKETCQVFLCKTYSVDSSSLSSPSSLSGINDFSFDVPLHFLCFLFFIFTHFGGIFLLYTLNRLLFLPYKNKDILFWAAFFVVKICFDFTITGFLFSVQIFSIKN